MATNEANVITLQVSLISDLNREIRARTFKRMNDNIVRGIRYDLRAEPRWPPNLRQR